MRKAGLFFALGIFVVAMRMSGQQITFSVSSSYELDGLSQASGAASNSFAQSGSGSGLLSYTNSTTTNNPDEGVSGIATGTVSANGAIGSLGVSFSGTASASNDMLAQPSFQQIGGNALVNTNGVSAQWLDFVTVNLPGVPAGTAYVQVTGALTLHGTFGDTISGSPVNDYRGAGSQFYVSLTGLGGSDGKGGLGSAPYGASYFGIFFADATNGVTVNDAPPPVIPISLLLPVNVPTMVGYKITLSGSAGANSGALFGTTANVTGSMSNSFNVNFSQTLAWGGISSVTDESGDPITGWTITSASGFDYTQAAVPEPSMLILISLGAIGIVGLRRYSPR